MRVVAVNRASNHSNLVHNDDYARSIGFKGGLVPGVDVYAYMTRPAIEHLGLDWLERGEAEIRFVKPVYDGDRLDIEAIHEEGGELTVSARSAGEVRALLIARHGETQAHDVTDVIPEARVFEPKLKAVRLSFDVGMILGSLA